MKRILIYKKVIENGEYDILKEIDYSEIANTVKTKYAGISPNWANRLWLQGIYSEISSSDNRCEFLKDSMTPDEINSSYDLIILPMANIFWTGHIQDLERLAGIFEKISIPTFVIACGVQADSYDDLPQVLEALKKPAQRFICAIYKTGGEFALRGEFTKEFFDCLGFHSAVVTGCPSLFQFGRNLKIEKEIVDRQKFRPVFNGRISGIAPFLNEFKSSIYFDQCDYFPLVYCPECWGSGSYSEVKKLVHRYGYDAVALAAESRLKLYPEMQRWYACLKNGEYHFSFGSRIHGSIMSILSGIPAVIWTCDSRTREMAEFFGIPRTDKIPADVYDLYQSTDYVRFNRNFPDRFDAFEKFLRDCGIVDSINQDNLFFNIAQNEEPCECLGYVPSEEVRKFLQENKTRLKAGKAASDLIERYVSKYKGFRR